MNHAQQPTPRIYLDNAATSWPKPESVYAAVDDYGNDAVWVVHLGEPAPERIVTGSHAVWSPA